MLRPAGIIEHLGLREPIYADLATYGHLGDVRRSWEWTLPGTDKLTAEVKRLADQMLTDH